MKLRDFVVVAVVIDLLLGVFLFGLVGGFAGGVLLPENWKGKAVQLCASAKLAKAPAVPFFAKEDGTEECDAVEIEKVLAQARAITASGDFLFEVKPNFNEVKNLVEGLMAEQ